VTFVYMLLSKKKKKKKNWTGGKSSAWGPSLAKGKQFDTWVVATCRVARLRARKIIWQPVGGKIHAASGGPVDGHWTQLDGQRFGSFRRPLHSRGESWASLSTKLLQASHPQSMGIASRGFRREVDSKYGRRDRLQEKAVVEYSWNRAIKGTRPWDRIARFAAFLKRFALAAMAGDNWRQLSGTDGFGKQGESDDMAFSGLLGNCGIAER